MESGEHGIKITGPGGIAFGLIGWAMSELNIVPPPWVIMSAFAVAALLLGWSAYWLADEAPKRFVRWRNGLNENEDQLSPSGIIRDVWLQDAMFFVVRGRWLSDDEEGFENEDQIVDAYRVIKRFRELANDGRLKIWGKLSKNRLHEEVPMTFWTDHKIDQFMFSGPAETAMTENADMWDKNDTEYSALMCNKAQVEALCREGSI